MAQVCAPGATQACLCAAGQSGAQTCADNGLAWQACVCAPPANGEAAEAAEATDKPTAGDAAEVPAGPRWYMVQIVRAKLADRKPSGNEWDGSGDGPADPSVDFQVQGQGSGRFQTPTAKDTLTPAWDRVERMQIAKGDSLVITVWDMDALSNDRILSVNVPFTGPKKYVLREPQQSLKELVIDIRVAPL